MGILPLPVSLDGRRVLNIVDINRRLIKAIGRYQVIHQDSFIVTGPTCHGLKLK